MSTGNAIVVRYWVSTTSKELGNSVMNSLLHTFW
jgi:hypothetical protein